MIDKALHMFWKHFETIISIEVWSLETLKYDWSPWKVNQIYGFHLDLVLPVDNMDGSFIDVLVQ